MMTRGLRDSDIPILRAAHEASGFGYEFPDLRGRNMEAVMVVADENDQPLIAIAAERILQAYLLIPGEMHPAAKMRGIKLLHEMFAPVLREKGYTSLDSFLPPGIAKSFGRRLIRSLGWKANWPSFTRRF